MANIPGIPVPKPSIHNLLYVINIDFNINYTISMDRQSATIKMNLESKSKWSKENSKHHMIDGAISCFIASIMLQPFQVIKTAMQIKPVESQNKTKSELLHEQALKLKNTSKRYDMLSFTEATKVVFEREGLIGYYRGFLSSLIKATAAGGIFFGSLALSKNFIRNFTDEDRTVNFCSAAISRTVQAILTNPIIVIKTRFEVVGFNEYNSIKDAIWKIHSKEGYSGFFVGLKVGIIRDVPFTFTYYPIYEESKHIFAALLSMDKLS